MNSNLNLWAFFHRQVRVNALLCLGDLVNTLDKHAVLEILQTIQRCTAVDRSPPTLMCTLGVANSILKQVIVSNTRLVLCVTLANLMVVCGRFFYVELLLISVLLNSSCSVWSRICC